MQAIRLKGAGKVIVTDLFEARLALAKEMGADVTIRADVPDLLEALRAETGPEGADVVLEAVGVQPTIDNALAITRKGRPQPDRQRHPARLVRPAEHRQPRDHPVRGVCSNGEYAACADLIASGRMKVDALISDTARLEDGQAVFDRLYQGVEDNIRTLFVFD